MLHKFLLLIYPPKCILCKKLLAKDETDLCHTCRKETPEFKKSRLRFSFVAGWTSVWYYKDNVRSSIHRFKFRNRRHYAKAYGRILAVKLEKDGFRDFDILTYVPVSLLRQLWRGYDQVELICNALGQELNVTSERCLEKIRNTPPQSGIKDVARRRANVLGAYKCLCPADVKGKRILLLDDVITTGATVSECARVLLTAGAAEVRCASVAVTEYKTK